MDGRRTVIRNLILAVIMAFCLTTFIAGQALSMPQFASATNRACSHCHLSALGGGPLTPAGESFRESLRSADPPIDPKLLITSGQRLLNMALYLIHILFGVTWVGLFLFLFLPAALRHRAFPPLPKGYLRQMWYGAAVITISGPFLAYFRSKFIPGFFTTRFGILLIVKILAAIALLSATTYISWHLVIYARARYRKLVKDLEGQHTLVLSESDLALFTGKGKRRPLFVYKGKIYDASGRDLWRKGMHPGGHSAGLDLTDQLDKAPHGSEVIGRLPEVGILSKEPSDTDRKIRSFIRAVYAGMFACFVILFVAGSWRWL